MKKLIRLTKHERIIAIVPEFCAGPGWSNQIANVHIVDYATHTHRVECLQMDEMPEHLMVLFGVGAHVHNAMRSALHPIVKNAKGE